MIEDATPAFARNVAAAAAGTRNPHILLFDRMTNCLNSVFYALRYNQWHP
jgi:hypothetical protein